jgi:hypothetical protein
MFSRRVDLFLPDGIDPDPALLTRLRLAFGVTADYTDECLSRSQASVGESPLFCWAETLMQIARPQRPWGRDRGRRKAGRARAVVLRFRARA